MPPQTRSKLQLQPFFPMGSFSPNAMDTSEDSYLSQKESDDWDPRYGAPIRPPVAKRKCVSVSVQTSPIEEYYRPLYRSTGSSTSNSPDPESDGDDAGKRSLKRTNSGSGNQIAKKAKLVKPASPTKFATPKQPRRDTIITLDGTLAKPRSIYAPSPTPLQCTYVYPVALGPPRRPVDLRRNKGAKALPEVQVAPPAGAQAAKDGEAADASAPADSAAMEVDLHKATHQCPITFSREFEMRRHIRTVHIAEEIRAVVEGRLPREQATVIPDNWDGKTLLSKPTCAGCGTTFSRPDAVRRHQTEVNAKMENGICVECPGPKVHIRRGPRKDIQPAQLPTPNPSPGPATLPAIAPAPAPASTLGVAIAPAPAPAAVATPVSAPVPTTAAPAPEAASTPAIPAAPEPQVESATSARGEPTEGELESEDEM